MVAQFCVYVCIQNEQCIFLLCFQIKSSRRRSSPSLFCKRLKCVYTWILNWWKHNWSSELYGAFYSFQQDDVDIMSKENLLLILFANHFTCHSKIKHRPWKTYSWEHNWNVCMAKRIMSNMVAWWQQCESDDTNIIQHPLMHNAAPLDLSVLLSNFNNKAINDQWFGVCYMLNTTTQYCYYDTILFLFDGVKMDPKLEWFILT